MSDVNVIDRGMASKRLTPFETSSTPPPPADDAPLPSLAPMVRRVAPTVVNVATRGSITESSPARNAIGTFSIIETLELLVHAPLVLRVELRTLC